MGTTSRQIGWSSESNLLFSILREVRALQGLATNMSTTTSSTTSNPIVPFSVCPGTGCGSCPFSSEITIYVLQSCADNLDVGCSVWNNIEGTVPYPNGVFHIGGTAAYTVVSGVIDLVEIC